MGARAARRSARAAPPAAADLDLRAGSLPAALTRAAVPPRLLPSALDVLLGRAAGRSSARAAAFVLPLRPVSRASAAALAPLLAAVAVSLFAGVAGAALPRAPLPKRLPRSGAAASSARHSSRVTLLGSRPLGMRAFLVPSVI